MERITNDHPTVAFRQGHSRKKGQNTENMSKEMKSVVCSESSNEFGELDHTLQVQKE